MKKTATILFTLLLVLSFLVFPAAGEENLPAVTDIGSEGFDCMYYQCTLPDGRVILTGWKGRPGNYQDSRARILCLNPDMTVSWEYVDPAEGFCGFTKAAVLKDGTLGVVFENAPDQELAERKLKIFTADGTPAGKEADLTAPGGLVDGATASCIWLSTERHTLLADWEGNILLDYEDGQCPFSACSRMYETDDGLVFAGSTYGEDTALIVKVDFQGKTVWKAEIQPSDLPGVEGANLTDCVMTEDGEFVAQLVEYGSEITAYRHLVRFSADGHQLWLDADVFNRYPDMWLNGLAAHDGRIVAELLGSGNDFGMNAVCTYVWTDGDGKWLATTAYDTKDLELPHRTQEERAKANVFPYALISTPEGLWSLASAETDSGSITERADSMDDFLVKVPEP